MSYLNDLTEQACLANTGSPEGDIADELLNQIVSDVQAGDDQAVQAARKLMRDGCLGWVRRWWKQVRRPAKFLGSGVEREIPLRYGIEKVVPGETKPRYFQLSWQDMGLADIDQLYSTWVLRKGLTDDSEAFFRRVRDAYHAHPSARNAAEACRLAGLDPNAMEV